MSYAGKINIGGGGTDHLIASTLYGVCSTAADDATKIVTLANFDKLIAGVSVSVYFEHTNEAANPTMNINGTGNISIYMNGYTRPGITPGTSWADGSVVQFVYDGSAWRGVAPIVSFVDRIYPVGSIYMSVDPRNPGQLFGGTWAQITDTFLLAAGTTYSAGTTGGAPTVTLTAAQMPKHRHGIPSLSGTAASAGSHSHAPNNGQNGFQTYTGDAGRNRLMWGENYYAISSSSTNNLGFSTTTASGGAHTHSVSTTASNTEYSQDDPASAHNNMPPYLAVYVWKRTA